ncbi:protein zer-1 homolog [Lingula anatina]|uniref:Protein zer-1 homolog n=1 Tax=Lingula anatina TaxID=7574 RepID=A0A1S3HZH0_LINAN|nr:protein zer-1 homolog [Lingula anatina]XP_023933331.1 protein zer-1 homolog [Lingula anatina]|eukprot:XP_013390971.1 protein zer-1 homolog [Lingula anatina]
MTGGWSENDPETLQSLCMRYCANNLGVLCNLDQKTNHLSLKDGICLPLELCEGLLKAYRKETYDSNLDGFLGLFENTEHTHLKHLNLRDSWVMDDLVTRLLKHDVVELDISGCPNLTSAVIEQGINKYGKNLQVLHIGNSVQILNGIDLSCRILSDEFDDEMDSLAEVMGHSGDVHSVGDVPNMETDNSFSESESESSSSPSGYGKDYIFDCVEMKAFSLHGLKMSGSHDMIATILAPFKQLRHLDLSHCHICVELMDCLTNLTELLALILYSVPIDNLKGAFENIGQLTKLRHLDLSQCEENPVMYADDMVKCLGTLVKKLPHLTSLDLSGTNLAGFEKPQDVSHKLEGRAAAQNKLYACGIPGLEGRRLEFLGLLNCAHEACRRENIPALKVTGDDNENQIILSVQVYQDKPKLLLKALNHLYQHFRIDLVTRQRDALMAILDAMERQPHDRSIQISGSASLFYIVKGSEKGYLNVKNRRRLVMALLDAMEYHVDEDTMLRNGCLTLCHFNIPQDVVFAYERVVNLLLNIVGDHEEFIQRISIYLLNSLACKVDDKEKLLVGDLGAITTMLDIIRDRLRRKVCDEVMEISWSMMWNVTDETAKNSERFIEKDGMNLFLECLRTFPDKSGLLRNMMGLIGNVAEVHYLRPKLMQYEYVSVFKALLDSDSDGIEVSYNAAGVLSHMASDGAEAWTLTDLPRSQVLRAMVNAIQRWDLNTNRNINYRSFEPILRLLKCRHTPEAMHWAVWALANLTKVYPEKYCKLVEKEKGLELLESLMSTPQLYDSIKSLASDVIARCKEYKNRHGQDMECAGEEAVSSDGDMD